MAGQTGGLKRVATVVAALVCCAAAGAPDPVTALAGRYGHHFKNGNIDGDVYWSDDVLEIVPVDARHAYFKLALNFYNGHMCSLHGVAAANGARLDYAGQDWSGERCRMSLYRQGRSIRMDDHGGTCEMTCGARGGYLSATLPWSSRRPIRYMGLLTASDDYRNALTEWRTGKPVNP